MEMVDNDCGEAEQDQVINTEDHFVPGSQRSRYELGDDVLNDGQSLTGIGLAWAATACQGPSRVTQIRVYMKVMSAR